MRGTIPALTWGGIRGGISVALALSLPAVSARPLILAATYGVVIFSVIVQGLNLPAIMRRTLRTAPECAHPIEKSHSIIASQQNGV